MNINFWNAGGNVGTFKVYEGIDFASLMSAVGGVGEYANLKKINESSLLFFRTVAYTHLTLPPKRIV